jgi:hypothetical protein
MTLLLLFILQSGRSCRPLVVTVFCTVRANPTTGRARTKVNKQTGAIA